MKDVECKLVDLHVLSDKSVTTNGVFLFDWNCGRIIYDFLFNCRDYQYTYLLYYTM